MMQRRNQKPLDPLPGGFKLLAIAHGTGKDDYLSAVLAVDFDEMKYVVWTWNASTLPGGFGHGDYIHWTEFKKEGVTDEDARLLACKKAIKAFNERAAALLTRSAIWGKEGA